MKIANKLMAAGMASIVLLVSAKNYVSAEGTDTSAVTAPLDRVTDILFDLVAGIGIIALILGFLQLALSFKSHDGQQKLAAVIAIVAGILLIGIRTVVGVIQG